MFHTEATRQLEQMEIKTTIEDYQERPVFFYQINCIYPGVQDSKNGEIPITIISTGAEIYETLLQVDQVLKMIENWYEQRKT